MAMNKLVLVVVLSATLFFAKAAAEIVEATACDADTNENGEPIPRNCTIGELRITPCPEAADEKPCKIKRGDSVTLSFDFTSDHPSKSLQGRAYWTNQLMDLPLLGMDTNACNYTQCPLMPGAKQTYSYKLEISKFFPVRSYDVKWRLWNEENVDCCFITGIKLVR